MAFGLIFSALFIAIGAIGIGASVLKYNKSRKLSIAGVVVVLVALVGFALVPQSFHTVEAGQIAVVKYLGEAKAVRNPGTYFDFWVTNTYEYYDSKVQNMEITTQAYSKDAQTMSIAMNVQYKIDTSKALDIANQYGTIDMLANRIQSIAIEKTKATLSSSSAMSIIERRSALTVISDIGAVLLYGLRPRRANKRFIGTCLRSLSSNAVLDSTGVGFNPF